MDDMDLTDEEELQIIYNYAQDLRKKEIDVVTKGKLINRYTKKRKITPYAAMSELGIPKTTFYTWLRAWELGRGSYNKLLENGWTASEIQNSLKNGSAESIKKELPRKRIDIILDESKTRLSEFVHNKDYSIETEIKIKELQNVLNRILMRIDNNGKL